MSNRPKKRKNGYLTYWHRLTGKISIIDTATGSAAVQALIHSLNAYHGSGVEVVRRSTIW